MLHNSISVDMKDYALQLKQKSFGGVSNGILQNFRTATFENSFEGLLLKRKQWRRRVRSDPCGSRFSLFPGHFFIIILGTIFLNKFLHSGVFQFGLCYPFL